MMTKVFIIHGAYGNPSVNWIPWLKKELGGMGCGVFLPKFPTPENQSLESWLRVFLEYDRNLDEDSIVIGHSLGVAFLLNVLERMEEKQIKTAFFVAGFTGALNDPKFDMINKTFADRRFDWKKIRKHCRKFFVFSSDNDPYVPPLKGKELAENLGAEMIVVKGAGHFNEKSGYTRFELLLEKIKKEI